MAAGGSQARGSEEDDVSDTTPALDEALERMAAASFELPNGFVNHGAMACEALAVLDCVGDIDSWARRFARAGGAPVDPVVPAGSSGGKRSATTAGCRSGSATSFRPSTAAAGARWSRRECRG
jgi:hypothetical protein